MIYQPKGTPLCGPASLCNAFRALGVRKSIKTVSKQCGTDKDGTDTLQMVHTIEHYGFKAKEFSSDSAEHAEAWLKACLASGMPVILCVDSFEHWVTCCGYLTMDSIFLVDSDNGRKNTAENGTHCLTAGAILRRWRASGKAAKGYQRYYGISLAKLPSNPSGHAE